MQTNKKSEDLVDGNDYDDNAHNRIRKTMEKKDLGHDDRTTEVYSLITGFHLFCVSDSFVLLP